MSGIIRGLAAGIVLAGFTVSLQPCVELAPSAIRVKHLCTDGAADFLACAIRKLMDDRPICGQMRLDVLVM